jgi:hypothetical protein
MPSLTETEVVEFIRSDPLSLGALVTTHKIDLFRAARDLFDECDAFSTQMGETSCISKRDGRLICHCFCAVTAPSGQSVLKPARALTSTKQRVTPSLATMSISPNLAFTFRLSIR